MRVCHRHACTNPIPDDGITEHCSDQCASIEAVRVLFTHKQFEAVMGRGAAVVHALPWMDIRAATP